MDLLYSAFHTAWLTAMHRERRTAAVEHEHDRRVYEQIENIQTVKGRFVPVDDSEWVRVSDITEAFLSN